MAHFVQKMVHFAKQRISQNSTSRLMRTFSSKQMMGYRHDWAALNTQAERGGYTIDEKIGILVIGNTGTGKSSIIKLLIICSFVSEVQAQGHEATAEPRPRVEIS
eukprot:383852_1